MHRPISMLRQHMKLVTITFFLSEGNLSILWENRKQKDKQDYPEMKSAFLTDNFFCNFDTIGFYAWMVDKLIESYTRNAFLVSELIQILHHRGKNIAPIKKSFWQKNCIDHSFNMRGCSPHLVKACESVWFLKMWDTNYETHCISSINWIIPFLPQIIALCTTHLVILETLGWGGKTMT